MEKLKAELLAKSFAIPTLRTSLLFTWNLFAESKDKYGIEIDAHAMIDPERSVAEGLKLLTLCMLNYREVATKIGIEGVSTPDIKEVAAWYSLCPDEARAALSYCTQMLIESSEKKKVSH